MGKMQMNKGKGGEREVVALFRDLNIAAGYKAIGSTGASVPVGRNHAQAERGGHDIVGVAFFAPEVKRVKDRPGNGQLKRWWTQACEQADVACREPLVVYRANHQPWRVLVWSRLCGVDDRWVMGDFHWDDFAGYYLRRVKLEGGAP